MRRGSVRLLPNRACRPQANESLWTAYGLTLRLAVDMFAHHTEFPNCATRLRVTFLMHGEVRKSWRNARNVLEEVICLARIRSLSLWVLRPSDVSGLEKRGFLAHHGLAGTALFSGWKM